MSDVKTLSTRNPYAKTVWITVRNTYGDNRLQIVLELDGKDEILEDTWVPCLDRSEGIHLHSHQLSNLFKGRDEEIQSLEQQLEEALRDFKWLHGLHQSKNRIEGYIGYPDDDEDRELWNAYLALKSKYKLGELE